MAHHSVLFPISQALVCGHDVAALAQPACWLNGRLNVRVRSPRSLKEAHRLRVDGFPPHALPKCRKRSSMPKLLALPLPTANVAQRGACRYRSFRSLVSLKPGAVARADDAAKAPWLLRIRLLGDRRSLRRHP